MIRTLLASTIALALIACSPAPAATSLVPPFDWRARLATAEASTTPAEVATLGWPAILKRLPAGGTLRLHAGTYPNGPSWNKPGLLLVTGFATEARPRVTTPISCQGNAAWSGVVVSGLDMGGTPTTLSAGEAITVPNCDFFRLEHFSLAWLKNNGVHVSNSTRTRVEIEDGVIHHAGQGNTKHNVYIGRISSALVVGLSSYASMGSHTFKAIARAIEVRDSWFGTVAPGQTVAPGDGNPYVSSTLMDMIACGDTLIENTTLDHFSFKSAYGDLYRVTGSEVMAFRNRSHPMYGCDLPKYLVESQLNVYDAGAGGVNAPPPFGYDWHGPLAPMQANTGDPLRWYVRFTPGPMWAAGFWAAPTPARFVHTLRNVTFIERGDARANAITDHGTRPNVAPIQFGAAFLLPKPAGWCERSVVEIGAGVAFMGTFKANGPVYVDPTRVACPL